MGHQDVQAKSSAIRHSEGLAQEAVLRKTKHRETAQGRRRTATPSGRSQAPIQIHLDHLTAGPEV